MYLRHPVGKEEERGGGRRLSFPKKRRPGQFSKLPSLRSFAGRKQGNKEVKEEEKGTLSSPSFPSGVRDSLSPSFFREEGEQEWQESGGCGRVACSTRIGGLPDLTARLSRPRPIGSEDGGEERLCSCYKAQKLLWWIDLGQCRSLVYTASRKLYASIG